MLRPSSAPALLALCLLAQVGLTQAQTQQPPSEAPPRLERVEEGAQTPVTPAPGRRGETKVSEKREGGRITEVEVNTGKSTYTMKAPPPGSVMQQGDITGSTLRPPQWKVMEFDIGKKKQAEGEQGATADAPPPPPPAK